MSRVLQATSHFDRFMTESTWNQRQMAGDPKMCDFVAGNPQELAHPKFVEALQKAAVPKNKDWYAYKMNEPGSQEIVVKSLKERTGIAFDPMDIFMTDGAFASIALCLQLLLDPGDEAVFMTPPWFFYEAMIVAAGGEAVPVKVDSQTFDLDIDAIKTAITNNTKVVIVNSPHNPTGKIYSPITLNRLSEVLTDAAARNGRPIYLLSDEAYSRIIFDGNSFHSPAAYYPNTFLIYTYAKTLLNPGMRLGYIAISPKMEMKAQMQLALFMCQIASGWAFPVALLQHALADIEPLLIDIEHLEKKRDRMVSELDALGYDLHSPEATFYLLPKSPIADDFAFTEMLTEHDVFVLPGSVMDMAGYFRISVTANDEMIDRSLPGFAAAIERARA
jgi:aspartate aminotransferase